MFSGIVKDKGEVIALNTLGSDLAGTIACNLSPSDLELGASVACSGICLTVSQSQTNAGPTRFSFLASPETQNRSTLKNWKKGEVVNLEPSLRLGDPLGGHLVFGHVDAVGRTISIEKLGESWRFRFSLPKDVHKLVAHKASIAVDGISLTVAELENDTFCVAVIDHSFRATNLSKMLVGQEVNLEADMLARYVARQIDCSNIKTG